MLGLQACTLVGVDVGEHRLFVARCQVDDQGTGRVDLPLGDGCSPDVFLDWVEGDRPTAIAIDAPAQCNTGLLGDRRFREEHGIVRRVANQDRRYAEYCLSIGGCYSTRSNEDRLPGWMHAGMNLYARLRSVGWDDGVSGTGDVLEVHPTYGFKSLLGIRRRPDPDPRLICDPESLLRPKVPRRGVGHRQRVALLSALFNCWGTLIDGDVETSLQESIDLTDALLAAALCAVRAAGHQLIVGDPREGTIVLANPQTLNAVVPHLSAAVSAVEPQNSAPARTASRASSRNRVNYASEADGRALILGPNGPGGFSQDDTMEVLRGDCFEGGGMFPVKGGGLGKEWRERPFELVIIHEDRITAVLDVVSVTDGGGDLLAPTLLYGASRCPWPPGASAKQWVAFESARFPEPAPPAASLLKTWQGGNWQPGLPNGRARQTVLRFCWANSARLEPTE